MKALLLTALPVALLTGPAYSQFSGTGCFDQVCTPRIEQWWEISIQASDHGQPPFSSPIPIEGLVSDSTPHVVGQVMSPGDPNSYWTVYSATPETIIQTAVTVTDPSNGSFNTFDFFLDVTGSALAIASAFDVPGTGEIGGAVLTFQMVSKYYQPTINGVYSGVDAYTQSVISDGLTAAGVNFSIPLGPNGPNPNGPDPLLDYSFALGNEVFTGSFDAYGTVDDPTSIHNITLFINNTPIVDMGATPVPGPMVGAGVPGLVIACGLFFFLYNNNKRTR